MFERNRFMRFTLFNWNKIQFSRFDSMRHDQLTDSFLFLIYIQLGKKGHWIRTKNTLMWPNLNGFMSSASFTDTTNTHRDIKTNSENLIKDTHRREKKKKKSFVRSRFILKRTTAKTDFLFLFFFFFHSNSGFIEFESKIGEMWATTEDRRPKRITLR